jgi:hypothetical protein
MTIPRERKVIHALKAYVTGDSSEPVVLSAFRDVPPQERVVLVKAHRRELEAIDGARLLILESMLLPLEERTR